MLVLFRFILNFKNVKYLVQEPIIYYKLRHFSLRFVLFLLKSIIEIFIFMFRSKFITALLLLFFFILVIIIFITVSIY